MIEKDGHFIKGEFLVVFVILCAMFLRLAFYPESRTPIALYGTITGAIFFVITALLSWRSRKNVAQDDKLEK